MNIAIIGAGVTGLTLSKMLKEKGISSTIFEAEKEIGGLCRTKIANGNVYDISGGHIFNSKFKEIKDWVFSQLSEDNWDYTVRESNIMFKDKIVSYPFELALSQLELEDAIDCLTEFFEAKSEEPKTFGKWLTWKFGKGIADRYLLPYNKKIWSYNLDEMSIHWVRDKMPTPTAREIITATLSKNSSEQKMSHSSFYYPKIGGISAMINAIAIGLNILKDCPVFSIKKTEEDKWIINNSYEFDKVISTIPLTELNKCISNIPSNVDKAINGLRYNSITTTIFECEKFNNYSWTYIPDSTIKSHRVVYQGNLYHNDSNKTSAIVETIGNVNKEYVEKDINKIYDFGKALDSHFTKYAYVIYDVNFLKNIKIIKEYFKELGIDCIGRFGQWEYFNMDICMKKAYDYVNELVDSL